MNNDKFTPGPWYAEKFCIWAGDCFVAGTATGQGDPEQRANARLIASAPDLLAALYSIATEPSAIYSGANAHIGDIARAAIAKATVTQ